MTKSLKLMKTPVISLYQNYNERRLELISISLSLGREASTEGIRRRL